MTDDRSENLPEPSWMARGEPRCPGTRRKGAP